MDLHWMKVYPGNLLMKAMGLPPEDKGRYYEAVLHLWMMPVMSRIEMESRIGPISDALLLRFDIRQGGSLGMDWLDAERRIQVAAATKNSSNRTGKVKLTNGISTGKTTRSTNSKRTPVPLPDVVPVLSQDGVQEKEIRSEITLEMRKQAFLGGCKEVTDLEPARLPPEMRKEFVAYWVEPNQTGTKMRFEAEKFFDFGRRMDTWKSNNEKRNGFVPADQEPKAWNPRR